MYFDMFFLKGNYSLGCQRPLAAQGSVVALKDYFCALDGLLLHKCYFFLTEEGLKIHENEKEFVRVCCKVK